jgi:predicted nucleotidyltransferase component of viral defense system
MVLIHEERAFTRDSIVANAGKYGFANPLTVELFLWDLELAAQLQRSSDQTILKGGAAVQLFLPVEKQRGSVDIDLTANLNADSLDTLIKETESRLGTTRFESYMPKKPRAGLNARTYFAYTDSVTQAEPLRVKLDFMLQDLRLPTEKTHNVQTFAAKTSDIRCYTPEVLVGDKMLTLAKGSIGLKDLADYPKQIYDLSMLMDSPKVSKFGDVIEAVEKITPVEAKIAGLGIDAPSALDDVIMFIDGEFAPIDTSKADRDVKLKLEGFEQFFVPASQRASLQEWSSRSLRIRLVACLAQSALKGTLVAKECESLLKKARDFASRLQGVRGSEVEPLRGKLLSFQRERLAYFKELRGKPLDRVFWQVLTPDSIDAITDLI